jgi:recombinational DNA repair ATPase RecF
MSELHPSDHKALLRAGFTEREIATQKRKFYNLTQINPCYTDELKQFDQLMADRRVLLEALQLADAMLSGANMNANIVEQKIRAAIAKATGGQA